MCSSFSKKSLKVFIVVCSLINSFRLSVLDRDMLTIKFVVKEITYQILEVNFIDKPVIYIYFFWQLLRVGFISSIS